jgi:hypothetical protein
MLIANADDYCLNRRNTDNILRCFKDHRISSTTAMMFMEDSSRAAEQALAAGIPVGLHLNTTYPFSGVVNDPELLRCQSRLVERFKSSPRAKLLYHPGLRQEFAYSFRAQWDEFIRLFGREPTHIDGHHYAHLCPNLIFGGVIPRGCKVRPKLRSHPGEGGVKRAYRRIFNRWLARRFRCVDRVYDISPEHPRVLDAVRLGVQESKRLNVEFMVHVENDAELDLMMSEGYRRLIAGAELGSYDAL